MTVGRIPSVEGGIQPTIVDAKGDLIVATGNDSPNRLAVGANDTVLTADSTAATGLKWAAPAAGGMTLLSTTNLSGTSTTVSSINQTYSELFVVITGSTTSGNVNIRVQANGSTTLSKVSYYDISASAGSNNVIGTIGISTINTQNFYLRLANYASTSIKKMGFFSQNSGSAFDQFGTYLYDSTTAITSMTVTTGGGAQTFTGGQIQIWGVK